MAWRFKWKDADADWHLPGDPKTEPIVRYVEDVKRFAALAFGTVSGDSEDNAAAALDMAEKIVGTNSAAGGDDYEIAAAAAHRLAFDALGKATHDYIVGTRVLIAENDKSYVEKEADAENTIEAEPPSDDDSETERSWKLWGMMQSDQLNAKHGANAPSGYEYQTAIDEYLSAAMLFLFASESYYMTLVEQATGNNN